MQSTKMPHSRTEGAPWVPLLGQTSRCHSSEYSRPLGLSDATCRVQNDALWGLLVLIDRHKPLLPAAGLNVVPFPVNDSWYIPHYEFALLGTRQRIRITIVFFRRLRVVIAD